MSGQETLRDIASRHNAYAPRLTEPLPPDAMLCRYHGWYFAVLNAGGTLVCRECMLEDGAAAIGWSPDEKS